MNQDWIARGRPKYRVRPWSEDVHGDAPVHEVRVEAGIKKLHLIPAERCVTIIKMSNAYRIYGSIDWLPASLLPIVDSPEWAEQALPYFKAAKKKFDAAYYKRWRR